MADVDEKRRAREALLVKEATKEARRNLLKLTKYGHRGDFDAALALYRLTSLGIGSLEVLTLFHDVVYKVAKDQKAWPVLFSPHRDSIEANKKFVGWIGLGVETGSNFAAPGAASVRRNPAIAVVEKLHAMATALIGAPMKNWTSRQWLPFPFGPAPKSRHDVARWNAMERWGQRGAGSRLPKLSKSTAHQWAAATAELFDLVFGDDFDKDFVLQQLRDHHKNARDSEDRKNIRSAIRAAMRKAIKQAWCSYAVKG